MDTRNFQKLKEVMEPRWQKPVQPGEQWCEAQLHCHDPQLSVPHWGMRVPVGTLKKDPPPMTSDEL
eukprot:2323231-Amphidinium_carterae.1